MPLDRSDYKINISTAADLAALKTAQAELKVMNELAAETGKSGKEMGEGFEISGHTAAHGLHLMGEAARGIDPQFDGIMNLARMARAPEFLIPAGAIAAWTLLSKTFDDLIKQHEAMVEWNRRLKISAREAGEETVLAMQAEMAAFNLLLQHQLDGEDRLKNAIENRLKMQEKEIDHERQLMETNSTRFEAYIKYLERIGKITGPQAEAAINAHKQAMDDAKARDDERKLHAGLAAKEDERSAAAAKLEQDPAKLQAALTAQDAATNAAKLNAKNIDQEKEKAAEMEAAAKEAEAHWDKFKQAKATVIDPNASLVDKASAHEYLIGQIVQGFKPVDLRQSAKGLRGAADTEQAHVERMEKTQGELDAHVKDADAEVKKWQDQIAEAKKAVHELTDAITQSSRELIQKQNDWRESRATGQRATQANEFYEHGPQDQESANMFSTNGGAATAKAIRQLTQEATTQIFQARYYAGNDSLIKSAVEHIVALFASHAQMTVDQQQKLLDLEEGLKNASAQLKNNRTSP